MTLEQLARDQGVLVADRSKSCLASVETSTPDSTSYNLPLQARNVSTRPDSDQCVVRLLAAEINTASFAMYIFSISVVLQALLIVSMSGAADHGIYRKSLLLTFALTGSIATMLFLSVVPKIYVFGALLAIISNVSFGASFVLLNSFLPVLVRWHPSVQAVSSSLNQSSVDERADDDIFEHDEHQSETLLHSNNIAPVKNPRFTHATASPTLRLSTKTSSYGIGIGYIAAVIVQTLGIVIVIVAKPVTNSTTLNLRIVLFFVGLWWFVFTIPAALWLRPRPGPPLPFSDNGKQGQRWIGSIRYAWGSLFKTVLRARRLKDVVLFRKYSPLLIRVLGEVPF